MTATSSGCPNDTDHLFGSVKTARTNPRKRADFACLRRLKRRRLASGLLLNQGEEYWKLKQISLDEGPPCSAEMFRDEG
jgi:hypothetical protein